MNVFIGGAWPYANGSLHVGHVSSLLPGDIIARYYRLKGTNVLYVSGSDCNGTPIAIRARQDGKNVEEITDYYHNEFEQCFRGLGFTYDLYTRTDRPEHHKVVQDIFLKLLNEKLIIKKEVTQSYCNHCNQFLPDRYVEGECPICHADARGDQCDHCSTILDPLDLLNRKCKLCSNSPVIKETEHFYFLLSKFQTHLKQLIDDDTIHKQWRENAILLSKRYLAEGLQDRAVSRDLPIGVPVPIEGFSEKKIYVWVEAVAGYLSASIQWANNNNKEWEQFWEPNSGKAYYVHGKDNIPFHTIIWPAILLGLERLKLPSHIISNEYVTIERKKISTSKNFAVWLPDLLRSYHPDSIRYYVTINAPEKRDSDFSWQEFIHSHNGELLGAYGNFVNRTLKFIEKSFDGKVPNGQIDVNIKNKIIDLYKTVGIGIEQGNLKASLQEIFDFIRDANKYFDEKKPWIKIKQEIQECDNTLYTCVQMIANLTQLLSPYLPFSTEQIRSFIDLPEPTWNYTETKSLQLQPVKALFERIDLANIELERSKLQGIK